MKQEQFTRNREEIKKTGDDKNNSSIPLFLRKTGIAALISLLVFFLFVYINTGIVFFVPLDQLPGVLWELVLFFVLLLAVFWTHGRISALMKTALMQGVPATVRMALEAFLVITGTIGLNYLIIFVPLFYLFNVEELPEGRLRTVLVLSSVISLFFYYFIERERGRKKLQEELLRSEQLQKENLRAQLNALKEQMNPHFLFNSLNVLASLVYVDRDRAADFTRELAHIYRSFLDNSGKTSVTVEEETELARSYLSLLQTRFGDDLQADINVPSEWNAYRLPPGAVQLLVENAIKHNGFTSRKPLRVAIYAGSGEVVVENNIQPRREAAPSTGHGLLNIKSRYRLLTEKEVTIEKTASTFVVRLPLLPPEPS